VVAGGHDEDVPTLHRPYGGAGMVDDALLTARA
jgi:hypothetical protein